MRDDLAFFQAVRAVLAKSISGERKTDEELDLAMREADVAIRLRQPTQPDLIQRKLFSVRFHAYASPEYLKRFVPAEIEKNAAPLKAAGISME